jgi:hypothetical protein
MVNMKNTASAVLPIEDDAPGSLKQVEVSEGRTWFHGTKECYVAACAVPGLHESCLNIPITCHRALKTAEERSCPVESAAERIIIMPYYTELEGGPWSVMPH